MTPEIKLKCISNDLRARLLGVFKDLKIESQLRGNRQDVDAIDMYMFIVETADECPRD